MPLQEFALGKVGSGSIPTFTSGSAIFAGPTGALSENNSEFFWDNTNHILQLGIENSIKIKTNGSPYTIRTTENTNLGVRNDLLSLIYNATDSLENPDSRIDTSKPGMSIDMEGGYSSDGVNKQMEWNHNYIGIDGAYVRGFVYTIQHAAPHNQTWQWRSTSYGWTNNDASANWMTLNSSGAAIGASVSSTPARLTVTDTTECLRLCYDSSHTTRFVVDSGGALKISPDFLVTTHVGQIQVTNTAAPAAGNGLELGYNTVSNTGVLLAFNRTGSAYRAMTLDGLTVAINSGSGGNVGLGMSPGCMCDVNGVVRAGGSAAPSSGTGVEVFWNGSTGGIIAFNRTGSSYQTMGIDGSALNLNVNTAGLTTVGGSLTISGSTLKIGTNPAGAGIIRLQNNTAMYGRNAGNSADILMIQTDSGNNLIIGDTTTTGVIVLGNSTASLRIINGAGSCGFFGASPATQQTASGASGYADSGATVVHSAGTFTGGVGSTAYTIGDVVKALKNYGLLVS